MKILIASPDIPYYNWQILVQINNFKKFGYGQDVIYVIGVNKGQELSNQLKEIFLQTNTQFYVYEDERIAVIYPSTLRLHILEKFFKNHPDIDKTFFYVDPDLLFAKKIKFGQLERGNTWYVSDTRSYLDSKYIRSKGEELFQTMASIVGLLPKIIMDNDENAGGAQYLLKNIDWEFWSKTYYDAEHLYRYMKETEGTFNPEHPIQSWTADMWAVFWGALYYKHKVKISDKLDFSWATDVIDTYNKKNLFHNAGVFNQKHLFNKTHYQKSPFNSDFSHVSKEFCSYKYVEEIEETKNNFPELIKLF